MCVVISTQSFFIPGTLYSHDLEPKAMDLPTVFAAFISFGLLEALLLRVHELIFFKMVAAQPVAAEL